MINIYNESSLHNSLKVYYSAKYDGKCEVKDDGHIYDIVSSDGKIIEIQTKNLSSLYDKLKDTLEKNKKIILVHPIVIRKRINLYDKNGKKISSRLSPKIGSLYDVFNELTKIYPLLLHKNFTLELVEIKMIEERIKADEKIQSKNKKRRYKRDWIKNNKRLEEIIDIKTFKTKKDYLSLIPESLQDKTFCAKDLKQAFIKDGLSFNVYNLSNLIIWVFFRMEILEFVEVNKRNRYYKIK